MKPYSLEWFMAFEPAYSSAQWRHLLATRLDEWRQVAARAR